LAGFNVFYTSGDLSRPLTAAIEAQEGIYPTGCARRRAQE